MALSEEILLKLEPALRSKAKAALGTLLLSIPAVLLAALPEPFRTTTLCSVVVLSLALSTFLARQLVTARGQTKLLSGELSTLREKPKSKLPSQGDILALLCADHPTRYTANELQTKLAMGSAEVSRDLGSLVRNGFVIAPNRRQLMVEGGPNPLGYGITNRGIEEATKMG